MFSNAITVPYRRFRFAGGITVDVAQFVLAAGISEDALVQASNRMQTELSAGHGFLGRLLTQDGRNVYLDILYWGRDPETVPTLAERSESSQACAEYLACLAEPPAAQAPVDALIRGVVTTSSVARMKG